MNPVVSVLGFLIFPGLLFSAALGLLFSWIDRKITARLQFRVGPPWYQGFADIVKLLGKETVIPRGALRGLFLAAPALGLAGATLAATMLWLAVLAPGVGFAGDLILLVYLMATPALAVILGGAASRNPLASVGLSREMKLLLAYELPLVLAALAAVVATGGTLRLGEIVLHQQQSGVLIGRPSGFLAFLVSLLCLHAKLGMVPFDLAEAETEIMSGPLIEYSGPPLAVYRLNRALMLVVAPLYLVVLYWGGIDFTSSAGWWAIPKILLVLLLFTVIRNTNPRVRIDQALRFFWGPVALVALAALLLAVGGR